MGFGMARRVFYSFDYEQDADRVQLVKNMGKIESQPLLTGNKWEEVRRGGDAAIKKWINDQMSGKSCLVVLVGTRTADRRWVKYEIKQAWEQGLGIVGVRIHGLKNLRGLTAKRGDNPFAGFTVQAKPLSKIVTLHDPFGFDSKAVYADISDQLESLVEDAIAVRDQY